MMLRAYVLLVGKRAEPLRATKERCNRRMGLGAILVVLLVLALIGVLPTWGYSSSWGYTPGGIIGLLLVIVIVLALLGRI